MYSFLILFAIFLMYAIIGWVFETLFILVTEKRFLDRGFLIGPYLPIYGCSSLLMILMLKDSSSDIFMIFSSSFIICTLVEYLTSYIMESLFHARWWDYSERRFNLNGRVCLENSVGFGVLGVVLIKFVNPVVEKLIYTIPEKTFVIISFIMLILFIVDMVLSFKIISKLKITIDNVRKDSTSEITLRVKKEIEKKSLLLRRIIKAFPNFVAEERKKILNKYKKIKEK